jgi:hypothetical protein
MKQHMKFRTIQEMACDVEDSGLCTPDWVGLHYQDEDIGHRLSTTECKDDRRGYQGKYVALCMEIEHARRFLFDELPKSRTIGARCHPLEALDDYASRMHQPDLPKRVVQLWD